jgi:hypothetical protein
MIVEKLALDRRLGRLQAGGDSGTMLATWSVASNMHIGNTAKSDICGTSYKLRKAECSQAMHKPVLALCCHGGMKHG